MYIHPVLSWLAQQQQPMLETLIHWSEINSGTTHLAGLACMTNVLQQAFAVLQADIEVIPLPAYTRVNDQGHVYSQAVGNLLRIRKRPEAPFQVLLCGHMDTVYPESHAFQQCQWLDKYTLNGPGVADMKGGLLVMLYALQAFEQCDQAQQLGWEIIINPDEEIGSLASASYLRAAAQQHQLGLVFEPALSSDGKFAGARKGSGKFTLIVKGRAAHVGRAFAEGRNAIIGLATLMQQINILNNQRPGLTINVGYCHGGGAVNVVPDVAICHLDIRTVQPADEAWFLNSLKKLLAEFNTQEGLHAEYTGLYTRQPKLMEGKVLQLYEWLAQSAAQLELPAAWLPTGGCCDGNNLAAAGLPNIDTLGVRGGHIHSEQEFILIESLVERAQLTALLLMQIAAKQGPDFVLSTQGNPQC